jgi:choline dehydrogenase
VVSGTPDIIVLGGGSAGCAMAGRLAEAGVKVLLLEAGKDDRHYKLRIPALTSSVVQNTDFDWKYLAEPDPTIGGRQDVWPGGKRLGGGSSINGMMYVRGHAYDYDRWAELGATGWGYRDVTPYFQRMETNSRGADGYRGGSGPVGVSDSSLTYPIIDDWVKAAEAQGIPRTRDHNGARAGEGTDYAQVTQRHGLRSSATTYLRMPGVRANLEVRTECVARRLLIEDGRAVGVEYMQDGQIRQVRSRQGVVLSAGSLNSPRLLMLSGFGPGAHLQEMGIAVRHDLPGVGANLQEHVGTHLVNEVNTPTINSEARGLALMRNLASFLFRRRGILTSSVGHAQAFLNTRPGLPAPNIQISFTAFAFDLDGQGRLVLRRAPAVSTVVCIARPQSRGRLTLRSADPLAPPVINHRLYGVADDLEQVCEGLEIARSIMQQPQVARYVTGEIRPGAGVHGEALKQFATMASIPLYHPVGTCKMGSAGDVDAVVDPMLALRGVEGLWVADASVFPTLPVGNTNATSMLIGDKGADHVLRAIGRQPLGPRAMGA